MSRPRIPKGKQKPAPLPQLLSVEELATLLRVPVSTVRYWRLRGEGPKPLKIGRRVRFDAAEVARWIDRQRSA